jgi:hypothetical protein
MVHYHFAGWRRLFGLIPLPRLITETRLGVPRAVVLDLIRYFFAGRHDWMLEKLGPGGRVR